MGSSQTLDSESVTTLLKIMLINMIKLNQPQSLCCLYENIGSRKETAWQEMKDIEICFENYVPICGQGSQGQEWGEAEKLVFLQSQ